MELDALELGAFIMKNPFRYSLIHIGSLDDTLKWYFVFRQQVSK